MELKYSRFPRLDSPLRWQYSVRKRKNPACQDGVIRGGNLLERMWTVGELISV